MIFGDLNAKHATWNCLANNAAGNNLHDYLNTPEYILYSTSTHIPHPLSTLWCNTIYNWPAANKHRMPDQKFLHYW